MCDTTRSTIDAILAHDKRNGPVGWEEELFIEHAVSASEPALARFRRAAERRSHVRGTVFVKSEDTTVLDCGINCRIHRLNEGLVCFVRSARPKVEYRGLEASFGENVHSSSFEAGEPLHVGEAPAAGFVVAFPKVHRGVGQNGMLVLGPPVICSLSGIPSLWLIREKDAADDCDPGHGVLDGFRLREVVQKLDEARLARLEDVPGLITHASVHRKLG
mmetsp:Transcript_29739/g.64284  ORF Transcript_29739/g.64284 Transcript_29739/m.64284 type:complete len:218 (-) Transcript_29739:50-703(-)